jgi:vacuolar protein sorting-associated protein IST1
MIGSLILAASDAVLLQVEHVIREENIMAAYDILELFCELIVVRLPIIDSQRHASTTCTNQ